MRFIKFILPICFISTGYTAKLPEFKTKQDISKIKYISPGGTYTFYQKTSGDLQQSTNYNFKNIFKASKNTEYQVVGSEAKKQVLFTVNETALTQMSFNKNLKIFSVDIKGETTPQELGFGVDPQIHMNDQMASFYSPLDRKLHIINLADTSLKKEIQLQSVQSFWRPLHFVITPNDVIYTDINQKGHQALLMYSFVENSFKTIFKASSNSHKLEACISDNNLMVGEFSLTNYYSPSRIFAIPLYNNPNFLKKKLIYSNTFSDIGQMTCHNKSIFFIKTVAFNEKLNAPKTEIVKLLLETNKLDVLSSNSDFNQIIKMGDTILTLYREKYFLIEGPNNLLSDEILKDQGKK